MILVGRLLLWFTWQVVAVVAMFVVSYSSDEADCI